MRRAPFSADAPSDSAARVSRRIGAWSARRTPRPDVGRTPDIVPHDLVMLNARTDGAFRDEGSAMNAIVDQMLDAALLAPERVRPLKRAEYEALVEAGYLADERVELLRGVLVEMSPQGHAHARVTAWFARELILALGRRFDVRSHSPFAATDDSEPEPDVSVSSHRRDGKHPARARLLIEVSDSSLRKDRRLKTEIYAEAGVPEYWIVDVRHRVVEVLTDPTPTGYATTIRKTAGLLRPTMVPGVALRLRDVPWKIVRTKRRRARR